MNTFLVILKISLVPMNTNLFRDYSTDQKAFTGRNPFVRLLPLFLHIKNLQGSLQGMEPPVNTVKRGKMVKLESKYYEK